MTLLTFELLCVPVIVLALAAMLWARVRGLVQGTPQSLLREYATLAVAGFVGEETSIRLYHHYAYASDWHARISNVPLLVPLIWPLVILSSRDVVRAMWPRLDIRRTALLVVLFVTLDASLVEVVAVRAGFWSWAEPGHLGVPIIGVLGWAYFAGLAVFFMDERVVLRPWLRPLVVIFTSVLLTHLLLAVTWWGALRWVLRGELGIGGFTLFSCAAFCAAMFVARARRDPHSAFSPAIYAPRLIAASLFIAELLLLRGDVLPLWSHVALIAIPYCFAVALLPMRRALQIDVRG